jgi:hypothetical protein
MGEFIVFLREKNSKSNQKRQELSHSMLNKLRRTKKETIILKKK